MAMSKLIWTLVVAGLALAACAEDDPAGTFASGITTTTTLTVTEPEIDLVAAADPAEPVEIPDDALDFTGQVDVEVTVQDNVFEQRVIVISPGTRVTWINEGLQPHNVKPAIDGAFVPIQTGELDPGLRQARTFTDAGDYPYYCSLHGTPRQGQTGRIIVAEA